MKEKICAVYQIKNKVTGERYVGSSKDVYNRWKSHKCPSRWEKYSNSKLYKDFQKYGLENFMFAILAPVEPEYLKQVEQEFIDRLKPAYNNIRANGWNVERRKAWMKEYNQLDARKEANRKHQKKYHQTEKGREVRRKSVRKFFDQICLYNGETMTLNTLYGRFYRACINNAYSEAKKYLIKGEDK